MSHPPDRCWLCRPWARVGVVVAGGLLADGFLPLSGHPTASQDCGGHPWLTAAGLGVLGVHFNWHRIARARNRRSV